jgi:NAD(P)-dependent dehydrogenase (short-subunit alcohol dehydrogenase family)
VRPRRGYRLHDPGERRHPLELAPYGVRVNAVAPGPTTSTGFRAMAPALQETAVKQAPLGRAGTPEEVAHWVVAVADPSVTWMTGEVLSIDGGMSLM